MVDIWQKTCVFCFCFLLLKSEKQNSLGIVFTYGFGGFVKLHKTMSQSPTGTSRFFGSRADSLANWHSGIGIHLRIQFAPTFLVVKVLSFEARALGVTGFFGG